MKRLLMLPLLTLLSCGATAESKPFSGVSIIGMQEPTFNSVAVGVGQDEFNVWSKVGMYGSVMAGGNSFSFSIGTNVQLWDLPIYPYVGVATTYLKDDASLFGATSKPDSETRFGYDVGLKYAQRGQQWYGGLGYNSSAKAMTMLVGFTF
jgi:hypothetical protein